MPSHADFPQKKGEGKKRTKDQKGPTDKEEDKKRKQKRKELARLRKEQAAKEKEAERKLVGFLFKFYCILYFRAQRQNICFLLLQLCR